MARHRWILLAALGVVNACGSSADSSSGGTGGAVVEAGAGGAPAEEAGTGGAAVEAGAGGTWDAGEDAAAEAADDVALTDVAEVTEAGEGAPIDAGQEAPACLTIGADCFSNATGCCAGAACGTDVVGSHCAATCDAHQQCPNSCCVPIGPQGAKVCAPSVDCL